MKNAISQKVLAFIVFTSVVGLPLGFPPKAEGAKTRVASLIVNFGNPVSVKLEGSSSSEIERFVTYNKLNLANVRVIRCTGFVPEEPAKIEIQIARKRAKNVCFAVQSHLLGKKSAPKIQMSESELLSGKVNLEIDFVPFKCAKAVNQVPLKIGTQTSEMLDYGESNFAGKAGFQLAINHINSQGGVLGKRIIHIPGSSDERESTEFYESLDSQFSKRVAAIIGITNVELSNVILKRSLDKRIPVLWTSSSGFINSPKKASSLNFRLVPPDLILGQVLAQVVRNDGGTNLGIIHSDDRTANLIANRIDANFKDSTFVAYNPLQTDFSAEVAQIKRISPDAIILISETVQSPLIIQEMLKQGIGPQDIPLYLTVRDLNASIFKDLPDGVMSGVLATKIGAIPSKPLEQSLLNIDSNLKDFSYAAETYDAVMLAALAAESCGKTSNLAIASSLQSVSVGGVKCFTWGSCKKLLSSGNDIDYDGVSGSIQFNNKGQPTSVFVRIFEFTSNTEFRLSTVHSNSYPIDYSK